MYQLGTVAEFNSLQLPRPEEVRQKVSEIAIMLDEQFGANRDVQEDEGGFIFIALDDKDLSYFREKYVEFNSELLEYVVAVMTKQGNYLNAFYLYGYDYGISLFMPVSIAPEAIMREALNDIQLWND